MGAELISGLEEVFIHDSSSDPVLMLEVVTESEGLWVTSGLVSSCRVVVKTTEFTVPCEVRIGWLLKGLSVVSVGPMTGCAEGLVFVPVDASGNTVDRPGAMVVL